VVDVQGGDRGGPGDPHGEVEQARGVAAAGEEHDDRLAGDEEPGGSDRAFDVGGRRHSPRSKKRRDRSSDPAACGQCGPLPRPAAFAQDDALRPSRVTSTSRPIASFGYGKVYRSPATLSTRPAER
jgi:hypothetical protein